MVCFSCLGYQNEYKGIDIVSHIWTTTPELRDNPDAHLLIAGKVQNANLTLLSLCKNVEIIDRLIPTDEFETYLKRTDVALLPYRKISQSGVLLTCMRAHVPVLVNNVGGLTDPFRFGNPGWIITDLKSDMLHLLRHPELIKGVHNDLKTWEAIAEAYSWAKIGKTTSKLYDLVKTIA